MHVHKEDGSVCETLRKNEEEQESEDSVTVNIQASGILFLHTLFYI